MTRPIPNVLGHTHYAPHPTEQGAAVLFTPAYCETCGGLLLAPNSVNVQNPGALERLGLVRMDTLPEEGWLDEDTGCEMCPNCPPEPAAEPDFSTYPESEG